MTGGGEPAPAAPEPSPAAPGPPPETPQPGGPTPATTGPDPCVDARRLLDERCAVATRARDEAGRVADALHASRREYDDLQERIDRSEATVDPRVVRQAKDSAQAAFHAARAVARTDADREDAARTWLTEINRINHDAREAGATAAQATEAARELLPRLERRSVEADAARIAAEAADQACQAARQALADCEEARGEPAERPAGDAGGHPPLPYEPDAVDIDVGTAGEETAILRLVRGDRATLAVIAAALGGDDPDAGRRWQDLLAELVDGIVARALEDGVLDFSGNESFWAPFGQRQSRDIARALSSLGYRFDGIGGWADDRVPSQRDLALAIGYAGVDPMRVRRPSEAEIRELYADVRVAADEYLVEAAGELSLADVVAILGRRADDLADVWNAWGRVRPLLLGPGAPPEATAAAG